MFKKSFLWVMLTLFLVGTLLIGCGGGKSEGTQPEGETEGGAEGFPVKDAARPFAVGEKGTVTLANDQGLEIKVQRDSGEPLFVFIMKKGSVADPQVNVAIQTIEPEMPEYLAADYVAVGQYAFEMHAVEETGYGFMLRPKIQFYFTDDEIEAAKSNGASLDTFKGNLFILYKEQRSPKWVPQKSVSIDEEAGMLTVSNVAGAGAWWLVAKKGE